MKYLQQCARSHKEDTRSLSEAQISYESHFIAYYNETIVQREVAYERISERAYTSSRD